MTKEHVPYSPCDDCQKRERKIRTEIRNLIVEHCESHECCNVIDKSDLVEEILALANGTGDTSE